MTSSLLTGEDLGKWRKVLDGDGDAGTVEDLRKSGAPLLQRKRSFL
jgi:hypothetical protein